MTRLAGRTVLVTGASRGIGRGIATRAAAEGARLAITARTVESHPTLPGSLNETAELCRSLGAEVHVVAGDIGSDADRERAHAETVAALGPVEVLVNNAAAAVYQPLLDYPVKRQRLMTEINVHAPLHLAQLCLPAMIEAGEGWIVNLSSASKKHPEGPPYSLGGVRGTFGFYAATKAMLDRMSTALASEHHHQGIRVNTVEPAAAVLSEGADARVGTMLRADQIESMEEMVEAALFLCDCGPDHTGKNETSLELIDRESLLVQTLDAKGPHQDR